MGASKESIGKPKRQRKLPPKDTDEYRVRRDRNNDSVRKSRDKSRARAAQTLERVQRLKEENEKLEIQVQILSKELSVLRDLFKMVHTGEAIGASGGTNTGAAQQAEETIKMEDSATSAGEAASYDGTMVNQEALSRDHEYFASTKY